MKKNISWLISALLMVSLGLVGCQSKMITTDYDSSKKLQIIQITDKSGFVTQNDRIVANESLFNGMSKEHENVAKPAAEAKKYKQISSVSYNLQLITLVGCLVATPLQPVFLWCGTSIGLGFFGAIPYAEKAESKKLEAANQHNETLSPAEKTNITLH